MCNKYVLDEIQKKVCRAAREVLGDKLETVCLYGSYARGDFDDYSDVDFFVLADIPREEAYNTRKKICAVMGDIDLEYDIIVSVYIACSSVFHKARNVSPFYMNVLKEGKTLTYA